MHGVVPVISSLPLILPIYILVYVYHPSQFFVMILFFLVVSFMLVSVWFVERNCVFSGDSYACTCVVAAPDIHSAMFLLVSLATTADTTTIFSRTHSGDLFGQLRVWTLLGVCRVWAGRGYHVLQTYLRCFPGLANRRSQEVGALK